MKWDCKLSNGSFSNLLEVCVFYLKELALRALVVRQHLVSVYVSLFFIFLCVDPVTNCEKQRNAGTF